MRARATYKVHVSGFLRSAYHADPEENACHTYDRLFGSEYESGGAFARFFGKLLPARS
jgi:hypothetical protein